MFILNSHHQVSTRVAIYHQTFAARTKHSNTEKYTILRQTVICMIRERLGVGVASI